MSEGNQGRWSTVELRRAGARLWRGLPALAPGVLAVGLLACVLVPLPPALVDVLLSLSLAGAVLLVVASLRVARPAHFLEFPTLLLFVTLFRLALNVSTTRLILSQANAGQVVDAFAGLVVRGDLLVGAVIFGIVTVIQYLVIARGAERVAEVAARFALDGMPGHQAAIEADQRAGAISSQEAARRRAELGERSSFHGAMDGAIRFVKGDAVAGLLIVSINLIGGLAVGTMRLGLSLVESLELFGRLTVGDGLIAQIPALLVSLAAGVLVSRVDRGEAASPDRAGGAGAGQGWLEPPMLLVPAALLMALGLVPGMPRLAFLTTGLGLAALALWYAGRWEPVADLRARRQELRVEVGLDPSGATAELAAALPVLGRRVADALGVAMGPLALVESPALAAGSFVCARDERVLARGRWSASAAALEGEGGSGPEAEPEREVEPASSPASDAPLIAVFRGLMDAGPELLDLEEAAAWVASARQAHPLETRLAMQVADERDLLRIARAFARERLPVPSPGELVRVLAEGDTFRRADTRAGWPDAVRRALAPQWLPALLEASLDAGGAGGPKWVRPTPDLEALLQARGDLSLDGVRLRRDAAMRGPIPAALLASGPGTVLLTTPATRPLFAALMRGSVPFVPVVSTDELEAAGVAEPRGDALRWVDLP